MNMVPQSISIFVVIRANLIVPAQPHALCVQFNMLVIGK